MPNKRSDEASDYSGISETSGGISSIKASTFEEYLPFIGNTGVPYEGTEIKILSTDGANKGMCVIV